jgi:hypothetical protein
MGPTLRAAGRWGRTLTKHALYRTDPGQPREIHAILEIVRLAEDPEATTPFASVSRAADVRWPH